VATSWPLAYRERLQAEFARWMAASEPAPHRASSSISWLVLASADDRQRLGRRPDPPAILLGGPARDFERLTHQEAFLPVEDGGPARWCRIRAQPGLVTDFGDPRIDCESLGWTLHELDPPRWREGYAYLVELAGNSPRIGGPPAEASIAARPQNVPPFAVADQGVGILSAAGDRPLARAFLRFLIETGQAEPAPAPAPVATATAGGLPPEVESLVADLIGAAVVDAQDELWTAWRALDGAGPREPARKWLVEPPPWPPASIEKYLRREGENAMSLIETLAAELSPEPAARAWLIRSWLSPPRVVDLALLTEMAQAVDGTLGREPRFRSWLRAEWTASARQRYRRVGRLAALGQIRAQFPRAETDQGDP
jgi:hypothetical protein